MQENKIKMILDKPWVWIILVIFIIIIGVNMNRTKTNKYITKYEWNLKDCKNSEMKFDNEDIKEFKFVVLGVENKDKDLESGEYIIKTNDNSKASFVIYITNEYYEKISDLPEPYYGMVQGFDKSEFNIKLEKGQYLYLLQNPNGQGKLYVNKKINF